MCQITHEKVLWLSLFDQQRQYLPIPDDLLHQEDFQLPNHTSSATESMVREAQLVADRWPCSRIGIPWKLERGRERLQSTLIGIEIFLDRWLLAIYSECVVYLYDTQPTPTIDPHGKKGHQAPAILRSSLESKSNVWNSYGIALDRTTNKLILALSHSDP